MHLTTSPLTNFSFISLSQPLACSPILKITSPTYSISLKLCVDELPGALSHHYRPQGAVAQPQSPRPVALTHPPTYRPLLPRSLLGIPLRTYLQTFQILPFGILVSEASYSFTLDDLHMDSSNPRHSSNYNGPSSVPDGVMLGLLSSGSILSGEECGHIIFTPTNLSPFSKAESGEDHYRQPGF